MQINILIAEDEKILSDFYIEFIEEFLPSYEINFKVFDNGLAALDESFKSKYDLIISDINMPHMDGLGFSKKIQNDKNPNKNTPMIIVSGVPQTVNFTQENLYYIMPKPIIPERFERVLKLILSGTLKNKVAS